MPNPTYVQIASITVGAGGASTVDFSSIPSIYTDLKIVSSVRSNASSEDVSYFSFNTSTTNFSSRYAQGNGSTVTGGMIARWAGNFTASNNTANTFASAEIYIPNYTSSNYKTYSVDNVTENNAAIAYAGIVTGLWSNTAAINQITLTPASGSYVQYSTFYLYGIKNS